PTSCVVCGRTSGSVSTTKLAKYRPAASLTTGTVVGVDGRVRDHLTLRSPIFGRRSFPPGVIRQAEFAVKRIDCRLSRFDLKRGAPMRGRLPFSQSKKFRYAASGSDRTSIRLNYS